MDLMNDIFFTTIAMLVIPLLAHAIGKLGVWFEVNQPTVSALLGAVLGAIYYQPTIYMALNKTTHEGTLAAFIVGGVGVGLAGAGVKSLVKDVRSGVIRATTEQDIRSLRKSGGKSIGA
jgi:hypothetical protein